MRPRNSVVRFTTGVVIGLLAAGLFLYSPARQGTALAGADPSDGGSVQMIPLQLSRESQGIVMMDTRTRTIWVYELFNRQTGFQQIRLLAARSWEYDRQLTEWNCGEPTPKQIRNVLEGVQQQQMIESILPQEPMDHMEQKPETNTNQ